MMLHSLSRKQVISVLVLATVLLHSTSGAVRSHDPKQSTCCKHVSPARIKGKIDACVITRASVGCLAAVLFKINGKHYCIHHKAGWLPKKMNDLVKQGRPCINETIRDTKWRMV